MKTNKKMLNVALASAVAAGAIVVAAPATEASTTTFTDVAKDSVHYNDIMVLVERGIIDGYGNGKFGPKDSVKRGHAAKMIAGVLELDTENVVDPQFKDVPKTHDMYKYVAALENAGIVEGKGENFFDVDATLTRAEMAKIIAEAFELTGEADNKFTDTKGSWAEQYIVTLLANEVTNGVTETTFAPAQDVKREQLASFVVRAEKAADKEEVEPTEPTPVDPKPEEPTPSNPSPSTPTLTETANVLVDNIINSLALPATVGTFDQTTLVFNFDDKLTTMADVKAEIEANYTNQDLEKALVDSIPSGDHFSNLLKIDEVTIGGVVFVENPLDTTSSLEEAKAKIKAQLTEAALAEKLTAITGLTHDQAKTTVIADYLGETGKEFNIVVKFKSGETQTKTITLVK